MGGALNTATPQKQINDHRKKSPRNTVTATIIFSYIILTSSFDVLLLYTHQNICLSMHAYASILLIPLDWFQTCTYQESSFGGRSMNMTDKST